MFGGLGRERGEFKRGNQRETVDSANSNSLQESRVRQNSEIVLNVRFNRNPSSPLLPAALRRSAEISRRPFKYRRETFSALSRISRSMSDACIEKRERERERKKASHDGHPEEIYYTFTHLKGKFGVPPASIRKYQ